MQDLLGATLIRLIVRGETVIGHYGRRGYIKGVLHGCELAATMHHDTREGRLNVTFDQEFTSFAGLYATAREDRQQVRCVGNRVRRRRS
jgi:hypothetical protein